MAAVGAQAATWYVKTDGSDPGGCTGGTSWAAAFATIGKAVTCAATIGDEIWVKLGTYNLSAPIAVSKAVGIYGGFAGTETLRSRRNWATNTTTVDGQNTVLHCFSVTANAFIDGFTITGGNANSATNPDWSGGGILNRTASGPTITPFIANCTLSTNHADWAGGGIANDFADATITNCTFTGNTVGDASNFGVGGGLYSTYCAPTITNCTFTGNQAPYGEGGGINNDHSSATITGCTFANNTAYWDGGGVSNTYTASPSPDPVIASCVFLNNHASNGGAIYNYSDTDPTITNCTFVGNQVTGHGAAIYSYYNNCAPVITNCIAWGNKYNDEIYDAIGATSTVTYSCIWHMSFPGTGNIFINPQVVSGADVHLQATSPCIDTGNNAAAGIPSMDFEGDQRILDKDANWAPVVDMGADEYDPGTGIYILHRDGAVAGNKTGWTMSSPPYFPGTAYAVDMAFTSDGTMAILHRDGALWFADEGWIVTAPPYYPGTAYARALKIQFYLADEFYAILHQDGAIYNSWSGWNTNTPPYHPGTAYARDLEYKISTSGGLHLVTYVLHRDGAIWNSDTGWNTATPPYYPGTAYAVDLEFTSGGYKILHRDGAIYDSVNGWIVSAPPYYPGTAYARDLEFHPTGGYGILHRDGAIYDSATGWMVTSPPYYPGTAYAVDLKVQ
jgi:hypothetical protein